MSKITLGSINTKRSTSSIDNYVGTIINSEAGYSVPKIMQSTQLMKSIYGEFPYWREYESLIDNDLPVCILPIVTRESPYNRASIRFSNGLVQVSYPKYKKEYTKVTIGNVITIVFNSKDIKDNSFTFTYDLKYYPKIAVNLFDNVGYATEVYPTIRYTETTITIIFNDLDPAYDINNLSGSVTIEQYPELDAFRGKYWDIKYFELPNESEDGSAFKFWVDTIAIPEVVVTDENGELVEIETIVDNKKSETPDGDYRYAVHIIPSVYTEGRYRIDYRVIPDRLLSVQSTHGEVTRVDHASNHYPIFKIDKRGDEYYEAIRGEVISPNKMYSYITLNELASCIIRYNLVLSESDFNFELLSNNQSIMNTILDFTNVSIDDLKYEGDITDTSNYIIIKNMSRNVLISTGHYVNVSTTYYNTNSVIYTKTYNLDQLPLMQDAYLDKLVENSIITTTDFMYASKSSIIKYLAGLNDPDTIYELIKSWIGDYYKQLTKDDLINNIHKQYNVQFQNSCLNINELVHNSLAKYLNKVNWKSIVDQFDHQVFLDQIKEEIIEYIYIEDYWLLPNKIVANIVTDLLAKYDGVDIKLSTDALLTDIDAYDFKCEKLLFEYSVPVSDMNFYHMQGLGYSSNDNLTYDKLCEYSEGDKVVEFYSKVKGNTGKNIKLTISKVNFYPQIYNVNITNGVIYEDYTVRLYDVGDLPVDSIFITDINKVSELVEVSIYNYILDDERLINSIDFNEYDDPDKYNQAFELTKGLNGKLRSLDQLTLPIGTFYLNRITDENWDINDLLNTIEILKSSDYYPDLFIVDELPNKWSYNNDILKLVDWNNDIDQSIFSQALINIRGKDICNKMKFTSQNNRLMYFYGDLAQNYVKYPLLYKYIINIINGSYLTKPVGNFLYDEFEFAVGNYIILTDKYNRQLSCRIEKSAGNYLLLSYVQYSKNVTEGGIVEYLSETKNLNCIFDESTKHIKLIDEPYKDYYFDSKNNKYYYIDEISYNYDYTYDSPISYLVNNHINFLMYDNINYFYEKLAEPLQQSSIFAIRYATAKITRELYKIRHYLEGSDYLQVERQLKLVVDKCRRLVPIISSLDFDYDTSGNQIAVQVTANISSLTNKEYKMVYLLNVE